MAEANRRVTDLSYGHFGSATYDLEERRWLDLYVDQVESYEEYSPACVENISVGNEKPSVIVRNQMRTLLQAHPDMYCSRGLISNLLAAQISEEPYNKTGDILAIGHAIDTKRISGSRRPLILASPCGGAGHILQLLRLRQETRKWGKGDSARLSVLSNSCTAQGYWSNTGGTIRQIVFSCTENETATWLAVRQDSVTTILRPCYDQVMSQPWDPGASREFSASSHLHANPVAILPALEEGRAASYSDLSFNPWYSRQLAVINSHGNWIIFELEKPHQKNAREKVLKRISGNINSGEKLSQSSSIGYADGWHRILWVCDIKTIVICNRHQFAIFDVSAEPFRLNSPTLISKDSSDWILDMKGFSSDKAQILVLTTTRVFWIQVDPLQKEKKNVEKIVSGGRILLSQRHYRDPTDLSLKLIPVKSHTISTLLTSSIHPLVNVYWFGRSLGSSSSLSSRRGSFSLSHTSKYRILVQSSQLIPCDIQFSPRGYDLRPEEKYREEGVEFFQLYILTPNIQVVSTLVAARFLTCVDTSKLEFHAKAPNKAIRKSLRQLGPRITKEPFIIPDLTNEESLVTYLDKKRINDAIHDPRHFRQDDLRLRLNWRKVFQQAFMAQDIELQNSGSSLNHMKYSINEVLSNVFSRIQAGIKYEHFPTTIIYEIINNNTISEDLGHISVTVTQFIENLKKDLDINTSMLMNTSELTSCPTLNFSSEFGETCDLMSIFDRLLELWMSTKPSGFSNRSRGASYKVIRNLAIDLYFSSFVISLRRKNLVTRSSTVDSQTHETPRSTWSTMTESSYCTNSSMPVFLGTNETNNQHSLRLRSPSEFSHATSSFDPEEDSAISGLRQYAVFIKSRSIPLGNAPFLKAWPSTPGSDPSLYCYEAAAEARSDEDKPSNSREEARRKRRTDRFLRQLSCEETEGGSQQISYPQQSASQQEDFSLSFPSQVDEISMTQPDRGVYGSRSIKKRKNKKQRTAGF
ncbi:hypothetical protein K3495_g72 [Podosphaera aphanis]|nr:hypothetical protein K3495_g72 [Podosphaera aphanis]